MDRAELADFLRHRRETLRPSDVGLPEGVRRRTAGLRREEVAGLVGMSTDYYARLEQQRGPQPSEQMLVALTRALRLSLDERDHLYRLTGHHPPRRTRGGDHVSPALLRVLDRLVDTPALVLSDLAETLAQNRLAVALLGDQMRYEGLDRSAFYRWFIDPAERASYPVEDHPHQLELQASGLRAALSLAGGGGRSRELVEALLASSEEFATIWSKHTVHQRFDDRKTLLHPELGRIEVDCQALFTEDQSQTLLVLTATPGSDDDAKLRLLDVIGAGRFAEQG
ncbi:helix-turn-helix transcriptional regulator [Frigoribacterium sp. PhB24]|uniref:helix-turn-helix transcriptional regulator n=1 Tax=Frigoribacterium sp. PhB24 TaxID=2485204 RepID=UPI000F498566|nr:helix-turn-helix transcriptional regulator [Frigoribacterium sp. PhB24]ROS51362.1 helix-turn-helix protein [Frigoribacterium sp. PhB24]